MKQTKFDFKENKNLDNIDEDLKNELHKYMVINEVVSDNLYGTIQKILSSDETVSKDNEKSLKKLLSDVDEFNTKLKTTDLNLEKKRTGLLSEDVKFKIFHFYKTNIFSQNQLAQNQLGRLFGVAQSTISRVVKLIREEYLNI